MPTPSCSAHPTHPGLAVALLGLAATLGLTGPAVAQPAAPPANPGITTTAPNGWWKNGSKVAAYVVGVDRVQTHAGKPSAYVKSIEPAVDGFGGMMQMCAADAYHGKRLRLSAWMKTENANDGGAHLWFRVDGRDQGQMLQFDNMDNRPLKGSSDWQQVAIVLDVSPNAAALAYGFFVGGTGQAWVSALTLEEVGPEVPTTDVTAAAHRRLPTAPVNLGFD